MKWSMKIPLNQKGYMHENVLYQNNEQLQCSLCMSRLPPLASVGKAYGSKT